MADGSSQKGTAIHSNSAIALVDSWLAAWSGVERLGSAAAKLYPTRDVKDGWRLPLTFPTGQRRIDILIGQGFPFAIPRLVLVDRPSHLTWPHVEDDGSLCLLPNGTPVSFNDPIKLLKKLLAEAVQLIDTAESGGNVDDFRLEFLSYWPKHSGAPFVRSLLSPQGPSRPVAAHTVTDVVTVADDAETLARWLNHTSAGRPTGRKRIHPALLVWLEQPMLPAEYPVTAGDVADRVRNAGLADAFEALLAKKPPRIVIVFGAPTPDGPVFAGLLLVPQPNGRGKAPPSGGAERGFRPGKIPAELLARRIVGARRVFKTSVERIDAAWIHGRDCDPDLAVLRAANVVLVGCGSLGGPVATGLAQAGVGRLQLIDPEVLHASNVGRHPLGNSFIGSAKAPQLAARIREDYPHIVLCDGFKNCWESVAAKKPSILAEADLIVSTVGEWAPEAALNAWRHHAGNHPDMLFGWTEPHAVAGHAVGLVGGRGCLACGLSEYGEPLLPVASWPKGAGRRSEPGCGVMYQPYGPTELSHVSATIVEAAVDILTKRSRVPFHRIWVAREDVLARAGAVWSDGWLETHDAAPHGARLEERGWNERHGCPVCGGA